MGKPSPTISAKSAGAGAAFQPLIPTGEQSGLLTRIAATENALLCMPTKSCAINVVVVQPDGKIPIGGEFSSVQVSTFSSYFSDLPFGVWGGSDDSGSPKF